VHASSARRWMAFNIGSRNRLRNRSRKRFPTHLGHRRDGELQARERFRLALKCEIRPMRALNRLLSRYFRACLERSRSSPLSFPVDPLESARWRDFAASRIRKQSAPERSKKSSSSADPLPLCSSAARLLIPIREPVKTRSRTRLCTADPIHAR